MASDWQDLSRLSYAQVASYKPTINHPQLRTLPLASDKIEMRKSDIPGAGIGIFATENIPNGSIITAYPVQAVIDYKTGKTIEGDSNIAARWTNDYGHRLEGDDDTVVGEIVVVAAPMPMETNLLWVGQMVNDSFGPETMLGMTNDLQRIGMITSDDKSFYAGLMALYGQARDNNFAVGEAGFVEVWKAVISSVNSVENDASVAQRAFAQFGRKFVGRVAKFSDDGVAYFRQYGQTRPGDNPLANWMVSSYIDVLVKRNAKFKTISPLYGVKLFALQAIRDIGAGDEILVTYGLGYWIGHVTGRRGGWIRAILGLGGYDDLGNMFDVVESVFFPR